MTKSEEYFRSFAQEMKLAFKRIRSTHEDSDVKGSKNEGIVADFLRDHFSAYSVVTNVEIIDSFDRSSKETDICICNTDQPFAGGEMVIAEGVDFVVQVKALLTSGEIDQVIQNCQSVKQLERPISPGDVVQTGQNDIRYYVERIPYFVFAFAANTSLKAVRGNLARKVCDLPKELQPDGLLILDVGCVFNCHDGSGSYGELQGLPDGKPLGRVIGFIAIESGEESLARFVYHIHRVVPRIYRPVSPLTRYFSRHWEGMLYAETDQGITVEPGE